MMMRHIVNMVTTKTYAYKTKQPSTERWGHSKSNGKTSSYWQLLAATGSCWQLLAATGSY